MSKKSEQPPGQIRLTTACVIDAKYFAAGEVLPFTSESEVPLNLRHLLCTNEDDIPPPIPRDNVYGEQGPEVGESTVYFQATSGQFVRRQARQVAAGMAEQTYAEEQAIAAGELPVETQQALEDIHSRSAALAKAELEARHRLTDTIYEAAEQEAAAKEARQQLYVKRGGEWAKLQNAKLRPGEKCFVRDGDEWVFAGVIDSTGDPPPQPIIT